MHRYKSTFSTQHLLVKSKQSHFRGWTISVASVNLYFSLSCYLVQQIKYSCYQLISCDQTHKKVKLKVRHSTTRTLTPAPLDVWGSKRQKSTLTLKTKQKKSATSGRLNFLTVTLACFHRDRIKCLGKPDTTPPMVVDKIRSQYNRFSRSWSYGDSNVCTQATWTFLPLPHRARYVCSVGEGPFMVEKGKNILRHIMSLHLKRGSRHSLAMKTTMKIMT